jgi:flagellar hook-associated protein 2
MQRYVSGRISILSGDSLSSLADLGVSTDSKTGQLTFDSSVLSAALNDDPVAVRRVLSRFGDVIDGSNASFVSSTSATKAGTYTIEATQARTRAQSVARNAAAAIVGAGDLLVSFIEDNKRTNFAVTLDNMSVSEQIEAIQDAIDDRELDATVFLDGSGKINIRHNQYGANFGIEVSSDNAVAAGSGFVETGSLILDGNGDVDDPQHAAGTDLKGKINGIEVTSDGDVLVGKSGFAFEDLRIRVSNDFTGEAGQIRLNDGLGSSFTNLLNTFIDTDGILDTRIGSFDSAIARIEQQMDRVTERASLLEERLRKQFVNLEVTLGRLNATGEYLTQQLKSLPGVNSNKK